jgi:competence protein ComEA
MSTIDLNYKQRGPRRVRMNSLQLAVFGRALSVALLLLAGWLQPLSLVRAAESEPVAVMQTVNINRADAPALAAGLRGVGPSKAEEIVRYREAFGPFESVDELAEVKGIGKSTLEKNRDLIILE